MSGKHSTTDLAATAPDASADDAFDALLRDAAHVSGPLPTRSGRALGAGSVLAGGRLSILRRIGEGGMGTVYEAFDAERNAVVALKTLSELGPAGVYQLKNEFRSLADVTHPNLVGLHELFADDNAWFFTMDLIDGVRFDAWVRPGSGAPATLDLPRLRAGLPQLLAAVDAIHAAGKLHRDLKPGNVLVTTEGRVVVLDFGLAVDPELGGIGRTVADYSVSGTPAYMAPEQTIGELATAATDLYALGVMLFEALTGRLPFEGHVHEMLVDKQRGSAPPVRSVAPEAPADLASVCGQLLAREPTSRPDSARVREALGLDLPPPAVRTTSRSTVSAELPVLLGRDAELAALQDAFVASCGGAKPVVVLLAGESGIGKSALTDAFLAQLRAQGRAVVLSGRCFERESVPFKGFDVIIDELSRYLRRLPVDQVSALLPRDAYALRRLFPVLGRLEPIANAPVRDVPDVHELRRRAFLALGELFGRIRDRQPLVLHVDDLQWSDADSTLLWMHLLRQPDAPRLLVIASHRSEQMKDHPYLQPLYSELPRDQRLDVRCVRLDPLSPDVAQALLLREIGSVPPRLVEEAAGNPFLLLELSLHAAEQPDAGAGGLSVSQLVAARTATLSEHARRLLEVLAVAARPIPLSLGAVAAGVAPRTAFEALRVARLARSTGDGSLVECYHDKTREALLHALSRETLQHHHAALASALRGASGADPEHLAGHLLGAGDPQAAAEHWLQAAERASHELGFERAARLYAFALEHGRFDAATTHRVLVARAEALAESGAGIAAADAFLQALPGATAQDALLYRQCAAEQLVYGGQLERGRELFASVFRELGMNMPGSSAATLASIVYHDARLKLRRYRWSGSVQVDRPTRLRLDALRRASNALIRVDAPRGMELGLREGLMALQRGAARDAAMAIARQIYIATTLGADPDRIARLAAQAQELTAPDDVEAQGYLSLFRAAADLTGPKRDIERAIADLRGMIERTRAHAAPGLSYHRSLSEYVLAMTRATHGELAAIAAELPARLDDAWNRNDFTVVPLWAGVHGFCGLAIDDVAGLEHTLAKAAAIWSAPEYTIQDLNLNDAQCRLESYRGDTRAAFERMDHFYARLMRSPMRRSIFPPGALRNRGLTAAALAVELGSGTEYDALVRLITQIARASNQAAVRGALACLRRDDAGAIAALRSVEPDPWQINNYGTRRALGVLIGGDEGRAIVAETDAFFRKGGVVDPERFANALMPGLRLRR